jgi:dTDP-4-dehydrorhamnose reductase
MRALVTGITGLLGRYLLEESDGSVEIHGVSRGGWPKYLSQHSIIHQLDLMDSDALLRLLEQVKPDIIVHAAAEGRVDVVERNPKEFLPLNVHVSTELASFAARRGRRYVFVSSNAVFGGKGHRYQDNSRFDPVNKYGVLKSEAENSVLRVNPEALVIRPILMYGWPFPEQRLNPVVGWIEQLRRGEQISVVDDVWTEPLAAWDCARAIWGGIDAGIVGGINVSGGVRMSLYEFAILTSSIFELDARLVTPISSDTLTAIAPRPRDTSFDLVRLTTEIGIEPEDPARGLQRLKETEPSAERN